MRKKQSLKTRPERGRTCDHILTTRTCSQSVSRSRSCFRSSDSHEDVVQTTRCARTHSALAGGRLRDDMCDPWAFPSSSPSAHVHPSPLPDFAVSSAPPLSSVAAFKNHEDRPQPKVSSGHLPELQEAFPQLLPPQISSHQPSHSQVTPPHLHHCQVSSPHLHYPQLHSPHPQLHSPHPQLNSPHPHVSSPQLPHPQLNSPHPHVSSPQLPHPQLHSPQLPHPHLNSPHPHVSSPQLPHPQLHSPQLPHPHVSSPQLPHPQLHSPQLPHPQLNSPHPHVSSPQLPHTHVSSPQLPHPHVSSPQLPHPHVSSPQLPHPQLNSPHPHVSSPQLPHPQLNSLHLASPHCTNPVDSSYQYVSQSHLAPSYNLAQCQATLPYHPYPHVASPDFVPQPQVTSPNLVPQCHIPQHPPPPNAFPSQHQLAGLDNSNWNQSEPSPELSGFPNSYSYSYQVQTTAHLDFSLQHQNGLSGGMTQKDTEMGNTPRLPCNTHTLVDSGLYSKVDAWEPLEPTLSQCSPPGSVSGGAAMGRWSSMEFSSSSTEDFSNTPFFPDSYHDNNASQSFCSPITPDPHYPQTPTISSPAPQMHPRKERLGVPTHTPTHLNTTKTLMSCQHESNSYTATSDPGHHQPQETSSCLISIKKEPNQDQARFLAPGRGQDASSAAQSRLKWKEERGGRGRKVGREGNGQPGWAWIKRSQRESSPEAPGCRLQCAVCTRDFRSLPALNGHMRSHSGIRAATCLKKSEDSSPSAQPCVSMVMPVSVPVQSRGASKMCRSGQRRCSHMAPTGGGGAGLFQSQMHLKEEEKVTSSNKAASDREDAEGETGGRRHYTPAPMLCPHRLGPGLYCSLTRRQQNKLKAPVATTAGINQPRINVGLGFQAQIPSLRDQEDARSDSHDALLLWTPWDKLEDPANQQRVEAFLTMAQSSVMPRGGVSPEHALHVLSESRGDFLLTVEKLLSTPEASSNHTGWSATERRQLVKSLQQHHKDFSSIQRDIQTKSLSQCVEFYYLWKKKMSLAVKIPAGLTVALPTADGQRSSRSNSSIMTNRTGLELHTT